MSDSQSASLYYQIKQRLTHVASGDNLEIKHSLIADQQVDGFVSFILNICITLILLKAKSKQQN